MGYNEMLFKRKWHKPVSGYYFLLCLINSGQVELYFLWISGFMVKSALVDYDGFLAP